MEHVTNKSRGWQRVLLLILPYIFVVGLFQFVGIMLTGGLEVEYSDQSTLDQLTISFFDLLGTFTILFIFMQVVDKESFINLGFHTNKRLRDFLLGTGLGALIILTGYLVLLGVNQIRFEQIVYHPHKLIYSVSLFFIIAVVEETLMRGYVLRNLMISFNRYIALVITSVLFTLMHASNPNIGPLGFLNLFLSAILLGIPYIHTKNLWFPIALHFSWNFVQSHLGFNVSGHNSYSLMESQIIDNTIFNGGAFGFEASVLSTLLLLFAVAGVELYYRKRINRASASAKAAQ